jgi:hypothetical protein
LYPPPKHAGPTFLGKESARLHTNVIVHLYFSAIRLRARPGASIKLGVSFKLTLYHAIRFTHADGTTGPMRHHLQRTVVALVLTMGEISSVFPVALTRETVSLDTTKVVQAAVSAGSLPSQSSAPRANARLKMPKAAWQWRHYYANSSRHWRLSCLL